MEAKINFGTYCILSYNHQIFSFPFLLTIFLPHSLESVSDLGEICAQSCCHIEAFGDTISLKTNSSSPISEAG